MPVGFPDYYGGLTLPVTVEEGGTGQTSVTAGAVLIGQGTSALTPTNVGTAGQVLQVPSGGGDPVFQTINIPPSTLDPDYPSSAPGYGIAVGTAPTGSDAAGLWIQLPATTTIPPIRVVDNTATTLFEVSTAGAISAASLALSTPLPISSGGTGTSSPALSAGAGISLAGSWPDITITNSDDAYFSAGILAIAHGGTGASAPALVGGSNISITGSWPDQTVAVVSSPTFTGVTTGSLDVAGGYHTCLIGSAGTAYTKALGLSNAKVNGSSNGWTVVGSGSDVAVGITGDLFEIGDDGVGVALTVDHSFNLGVSGSLHLGTPLAVAYGGTGTSSPALVAGAGITITGSWPDQTIALTAGANAVAVSASADHTGETSSIGATTLLTPSAAAMYRLSVEVYFYNSAGGGDNLTVNGIFTQNGNSQSVLFFNQGLSVAGTKTYSASMYLYCDASTAIQFSTSATIAAGDHYDIHARLELLS